MVFASGLPVSVMVELPTGVELVVVIVSVLVQVGLQLGLEKLAVAPVGRPLAVRLTACVGPDTRVAVMVLLPDAPWTTLIVPEFPRL